MFRLSFLGFALCLCLSPIARAQDIPRQEAEFFALFDKCSERLAAANLVIVLEQVRDECSAQMASILMPGIKDWPGIVLSVAADQFFVELNLQVSAKRDIIVTAREDKQYPNGLNAEYPRLLAKIVALNPARKERLLISGTFPEAPPFFGSQSGGLMKLFLRLSEIRRP